MSTVAEFVNSIEHLDDSCKAALKAHVQTREFGAKLDDDCDEAFRETLQNYLPETFSRLQCTRVKQALRLPGQ